MRWTTVLRRIAGLERTCLEGGEFEGDDLVLRVRPEKRFRWRCPQCRRRRPGYDFGHGKRRWRSLDLGTIRTYLEAAVPRVECPVHGVLVAEVPWARPSSRFTRAFEDTVAWLAARTDKTAVTQLLRIAWRTVGSIIQRVTEEGASAGDRLANLYRIGIDEISYRRHHKYVVVVVDHDTGRLVWARPGRKADTVREFFEELGIERCEQLELVSADGADWIHRPVHEYCPQATLCLDPFHIVQWATEALDEVRRAIWSELRRSGAKAEALSLQRSRYALWKNPEKLTDRQRAKLSDIQKTNRPLYRAYLLKEQLREAVRTKGDAGRELLARWCKWAQRCRLPSFVKLGRRIRKHLPAIHALFEHGLSNARVEGLNTRLRLISRMAYGFHSAVAFIGLGLLKLGGLCPELPGRA